MYCGVPSIIVECVAPSMMRAIPKSVSIAASSDSLSSTFSGFTSRCTTPARCAACNAPASWAPHAATPAGSIDPRARSSPRRSEPSINGMTTASVVPSTTRSCTETTCGCRIASKTVRSETNLVTNPGSAASSLRRTLIAHGRPSVSRPAHTCPHAP